MIEYELPWARSRLFDDRIVKYSGREIEIPVGTRIIDMTLDGNFYEANFVDSRGEILQSARIKMRYADSFRAAVTRCGTADKRQREAIDMPDKSQNAAV